MTKRRAVFVALSAVALVLVGYELVRIDADLRDPADLHGVVYVGSESCRGCHRDRHRTWARTFHRTMTQEASEASVLGAFDGRTLRYGGVTARMDRAVDGAYRITFSAPGRLSRSVVVARTVGSHRHQQYLAREDDLFVRLPIAWHVEEGRFIHMNGAFLTPDPEEPTPGGTISDSDYDRHVVRWNDNCVFCHNVAPRPGLEGDRFDTTVGELGIACEACHGPGARHVEARHDLVRSFALSLAGERDPTIVDPERLDPAQSAEVCGRCHGQRITDDIGRFLRDGDPFVPGDTLSDYSTPLARDTPLRGDAEAFAPRFWRDGTARLSAYEYQGLLASPCYARGDGRDRLTCTTCHGMHEGDPRGQLRPEARGDGACVDCHTDLATDAALEAHAHHPATSEGARCTRCHMPRIVYGLVDVLLSHRIEIPDPARDAANGRPDACTLCHVDETRAWAIDEARRWWPALGAELSLAAPRPDAGDETRRGDGVSPFSEGTTAEDAPFADGAPFSEAARALLSGDPIARAVAARALGRTGAPARRTEAPRRLAVLLDTLEHDPYPAVRRIAWRAAKSLAPAALALDDYDPMGTAADRATACARAALGTTALAPLDDDAVRALRRRAEAVAIEIGE